MSIQTYRRKIDDALEAIDDLFSDSSGSLQKSYDSLCELRTDLDIKIDALKGDMKRQARER